MLVHTSLFVLVFGVISWLLLPYLLEWIGNPIYQSAIHWYPWLLSAMALFALVMVPHFALYARGLDKPIVGSHIFSLLVFLLLTYSLSFTLAEQAVLVGLNAAFAVILVWKAFALRSAAK